MVEDEEVEEVVVEEEEEPPVRVADGVGGRSVSWRVRSRSRCEVSPSRGRAGARRGGEQQRSREKERVSYGEHTHTPLRIAVDQHYNRNMVPQDHNLTDYRDRVLMVRVFV